MRVYGLLIGAAVMTAAMAANAQDAAPPAPIGLPAVSWAGPYGGFNFGGEWNRLPGSITIGPTPAGPGSPAQAPSSFGLSNRTSTGFTGGGQFGYNWQWDNWIVGAEVDMNGHSATRSTTLSGAGLPFLFVPGDSFRAHSAWDASIRGRLGYGWERLMVYATAGVAFADMSLTTNFIPVGLFPPSTATGSSTLVGPTIGAGAEYWLGSNISLAAEYRYTDYGSDHYNLGTLSTFGPLPGGGFATAPVTGSVGLRTNAVLAKINVHFGGPSPAPPEVAPAAAPPPQRKVFLVFFDWDRSTITPEGLAIIQQAAEAFKAGAPVKIMVTGYTDRSGSPGYNQRLSERRASNVAVALERLGVPRDQMALTGRGENDNRVPTADGVREPQNRRVEIVFP